jgi:hypothetical protein
LPENCPATLQPAALERGKKCLCGLPYDGKLVTVSTPAVFYPLGRARRVMELMAYDCPKQQQACRIYPTGEDQLLHVCSDQTVICDAVFYNTLEQVCICFHCDSLRCLATAHAFDHIRLPRLSSLTIRATWI